MGPRRRLFGIQFLSDGTTAERDFWTEYTGSATAFAYEGDGPSPTSWPKLSRKGVRVRVDVSHPTARGRFIPLDVRSSNHGAGFAILLVPP